MGYLLPITPQDLYSNIQNICVKFDTYQCPPDANGHLHLNSCTRMCEDEAEDTEAKGNQWNAPQPFLFISDSDSDWSVKQEVFFSDTQILKPSPMSLCMLCSQQQGLHTNLG